MAVERDLRRKLQGRQVGILPPAATRTDRIGGGGGMRRILWPNAVCVGCPLSASPFPRPGSGRGYLQAAFETRSSIAFSSPRLARWPPFRTLAPARDPGFSELIPGAVLVRAMRSVIIKDRGIHRIDEPVDERDGGDVPPGFGAGAAGSLRSGCRAGLTDHRTCDAKPVRTAVS